MTPLHDPTAEIPLAATDLEGGRELGPLDRRAAWYRAYALLGDLLVDGVGGSGIEAAKALPELGERLSDGVDEGELAAAHRTLLQQEVRPYASGFLGGDGRALDTLHAAHTALGLRVPTDPSADHLGQGLRLLAALIDAELEALTHEDREDAATLRRWQVRVLDEALLPWMPPLLAALSGQPSSPWTRAIRMAVGVMAKHRASDASLPDLVGGDDGSATLEPVVFLDDRRTDLAAVREILRSPLRCGAFLSRRDLATVARACDLPVGFGSRKDMLDRMLSMAEESGSLPRMMGELGRLLAARDDVLASLAAEPGLAAQVPWWRQRMAAGQALVERVARVAEGLRGAS